jgi:glucose/mannose-6-phosphate isomerase
MRNFVENFTDQVLQAIDSAKNTKLSKIETSFTNIVISGLGGSGIGGSFIQDYCQAQGVAIPIIINKDYDIPAFVNNKTLFIACSYSGNTEETLESIAKAQQKKAIITCITSGGKLAEFAAKHKKNLISLPSGYPPRAAFGFAAAALLATLQQYKVIKNTYINDMYAAVGLLTSEHKAIQKQAATIAKKLVGKTIVLYAVSGMESMVVRWRQQINENGKMLASHHVIPEMNHNELVGWRQKGNYATVILRNSTDHKRSQARIEINKPIIKKYSKTIIEVYSQGDTFLQKAFYLLYLGDWVSVYLAEYNKLDATEVKVIDHLKAALVKA